MLAKLRRYGVSGKVYDWIKAFLSERQQGVVVDGEKSSFQNVRSGVPQGTVLGPVLFIIYIIDMVMSIKSSKALSFADDTKLIQAIISVLCRDLLQTDLNKVTEWSTANNMVLHQDKFEVMNYCLNRSLLLRHLPFTCEIRQYTTSDGSIIEPTNVVRDLGVYLSNDCSWRTHIQTIAMDARKVASWVLGTFRDRSTLTMLTLYKSLVRSKLEYCSPVWDPSKIQDIKAVEEVQRHFTKRISGSRDLSYWDRLKKLHITSLQRRRERYSMIQVRKVLNDKAPNSTRIEFYTNDRLGVKAKIAKFNHKAQRSVATAYDNSFGVKAVKLWNLLPKRVNSITDSIDGFKTALGDFIGQFPDMPPVQGYTPPNSNSLLAWSCWGERGERARH